MTTTRRYFLKLGLVAAALVPFGPRLRRLASRRVAPGFHLVNGWILTDADVEALGKYL
jgi:hypothetical protein